MSSLFDIHIELVSGPTVWVRFEVCHPDQWNVPVRKDITLLVVVEAYRNMKEGFGFQNQRQPISREAANKLVDTHPYRSKLEFWSDLYRRFDGVAFDSEAIIAIANVEIINEHGNPKQQDGDPYPRATLGFTVYDPGIISHLVSGFHFDSAMCDTSYW